MAGMFEAVSTERSQTKLRVPQLANLQDRDDMENYLYKLEQNMKTFDTPEESWMPHLTPLLSGQVLAQYKTVASEDGLDN